METIVVAERNGWVETERLVVVLPIRNQNSDPAERTMQIYVLGPPEGEENLSAAGCEEQMSVVAAVAAEDRGEPDLSIRSTMHAYSPLAEERNNSSMR